MEESSVYMDPNIDLSSRATIEIIIQFRTRPAHTYMRDQQQTVSYEAQKKAVAKSHDIFFETIHNRLLKKDIPYNIQHVYKVTFNGVSMKIRAIHIHHLLPCSEIGAIYLNREMKIPTQPNDPRYQL